MRITGVGPVAGASPGDLTFLRSPAFLAALATSEAAAVVTLPDLDVGDRPALRSPDPSADFFRAAAILVPDSQPVAGVDSAAHVAATAEVDATAAIGPGCVVGEGVRIGARSVLYANVVLGDGVTLGDDCALHPGVSVRAAATLGDRVLLQSGVVVGGEGFGYVGDPSGGLRRAHNVGSVVIEDDVEIGANSTVDRGTLANTVIGRGTKIDNLVQVGHNCVIGQHVVLAAQVGLAGSTVIEDRAVLMGQVGVAGHLTIGASVFANGQTGITKDVAANTRVWGTPQREAGLYRRELASLRQLPKLLKRVRALEKSREGNE